MKKGCRIAALMLAVAVLLAAFSGSALAVSSNKVVGLKTGRWYKLVDAQKNKTLYSMKLKADSIITVSWKGCSDYIGFDILKNTKNNGGIYHKSIFSRKGSASIALAKGNYYLRMDMVGPEDEPAAQAKITVQKAVNKNNYCMANALSLSSGKTVKIAQTPDHCYARWYKIKLSRKKTVTVQTNDGYDKSIAVYDKKMNKIKCKTTGKKAVTRTALKAGIYYICVAEPKNFNVEGADSGDDGYVGHYITVKWS